MYPHYMPLNILSVYIVGQMLDNTMLLFHYEKRRSFNLFQILLVLLKIANQLSQPLHDREVWLDGYFQPISPTQSVSFKQLVTIGKLEYAHYILNSKII